MLGKSIPDCIVCFDSLRPCQQFFNHVGTDLPELNQGSNLALASFINASNFFQKASRNYHHLL